MKLVGVRRAVVAHCSQGADDLCAASRGMCTYEALYCLRLAMLCGAFPREVDVSGVRFLYICSQDF